MTLTEDAARLREAQAEGTTLARSASVATGVGHAVAGSAAEYAPKAKRGKYALYPQLGPSVAFSLSSATFLITALTMTDQVFLEWGWRLPFIGSLLLVALGLFVRLKIEETSAFEAAKASGSVARPPVFDVITRQPREVFLGAFVPTTVFAFFYIGVTYLTTYGTAVLEHPRTTVLALGSLGGAVFAATTVLGAVSSDRRGRKRHVLVGNLASVVVGVVAFPDRDLVLPDPPGAGEHALHPGAAGHTARRDDHARSADRDRGTAGRTELTLSRPVPGEDRPG